MTHLKLNLWTQLATVSLLALLSASLLSMGKHLYASNSAWLAVKKQSVIACGRNESDGRHGLKNTDPTGTDPVNKKEGNGCFHPAAVAALRETNNSKRRKALVC